MARQFRKGLPRVYREFKPAPDGPIIVQTLQTLFKSPFSELPLGARVLFVENMMSAGLLRNFSVSPGADRLTAIVEALTANDEGRFESEINKVRQITQAQVRLKAAKRLVKLVLTRLRRRGGSNVSSFSSKFVHMHIPWVPLQDHDATHYLRLCIKDTRPKVSTYADFADAIYEFVNYVGITTDDVPKVDRFLVDSWRRLQDDIERAEVRQTADDEETLTAKEITSLDCARRLRSNRQ